MQDRMIIGLLICLLLLTISLQASDKKPRSAGVIQSSAETVTDGIGAPSRAPHPDPNSVESIARQVISAGGTAAVSTNFILLGITAQTATGSGASTSYSVGHGFWGGGAAGPGYVCGDADGNEIVNISDAVYLIAYIFGGGPQPDPLLSGDSDCNEIVNISDAVYLIAYIFGGGPRPCENCP